MLSSSCYISQNEKNGILHRILSNKHLKISIRFRATTIENSSIYSINRWQSNWSAHWTRKFHCIL